MAQIHTINQERFNQFFREDIESDVEQLERLLEIFQKQFQEFKKVCSAAEFDELKNSCHRLKSSCHSFGASSLLGEMESLEIAAQEKRDTTVLIERSLKVFEQTLSELSDLLKKLKEDS